MADLFFLCSDLYLVKAITFNLCLPEAIVMYTKRTGCVLGRSSILYTNLRLKMDLIISLTHSYNIAADLI